MLNTKTDGVSPRCQHANAVVYGTLFVITVINVSTDEFS